MDLKIKGGNSLLAKSITDKIGNEKILTERCVSRIVQEKRGGVKVYCKNGEEFTGDKIICTAPAFTAKRIKWEPGLPTEYENALEELQYARINKKPIIIQRKVLER